MKRPLFAAAAAVVAVLWAGLAAGWYENPPPERIGTEGAEQSILAQSTLAQQAPWYVTGQVCRKEEDKIWLKSVIICDSDFNESIPYKEKLICELTDGGADIPLGSVAAVSGTFAFFSGATNPGEFDGAAYYRSLGAGGRLKEARVLGQSKEYWRVRERLYQAKLYLKERLYRVFPEREATVMCALLLGEKGDTDRDLKELYRRNGILHILSISSLHITIIGMSLYRLLRRLRLPVVPCAGVGAAALILYGMMTGFSVSACRAIGMYLIRMLGEICGRTYDMLTALGILAAGMALANPYYLQNPGFLLSFSAVLGIGWIYPVLVPKEHPVRPNYYGENKALLLGRKLLRKLKYAALANLSITLATLPVQLWFYYEVPVWGTALNLLVLPLLKPALITGFLSLVPGLGRLGAADRLVLWWYETACGIFDKMPLGVWNPGRPEIWQIWAYYGALACVLLLTKIAGGRAVLPVFSSAVHRISGKMPKKASAIMPKKTFVIGDTALQGGFVSCCAGILRGAGLTAAVLLLAVRPGAQTRVLFLDVGQGDCCLIQTASGVNYLFDCGSSSRSKVGQYVLLPALKYYGIRQLDGIFLSHPDLDHMNGILELLELAEDNRLAVKQLILPAVEETAREEEFGQILAAAAAVPGQKQSGGVRVAWLGAGDSWNCGDVRFLCLHPAKGYSSAEGNAYSECIYAEFGSFSLLLTGDVEGEGEEALAAELKSRGITDVTLLKAAHHGSRNSTSPEFLEQSHARAVVISCGRNNRYGHPHGELLERLEQAGSHIFRTDLGGAVILREKGDRVEAGYYVQTGEK
ncbi:MAG: DNA internalization-related competence protein ComEC/Rec2 [Butyrivibrio sp.]|nr:DNA internalization-related competence protein ComEC/Rec2 [Acetatifactor muris]MCM1560766.1 DNA internalization-related competence protein ComEC/Rec2 [Butyrivibrio sp.]